MKNTINLTINNIPVCVKNGATILQAASKANVRIPTLCYLKEINQIGACRMCLVEVEGMRNLVAACVYPASEGMKVFTNTPRVIASRKCTLELLLSNHNQNCLSCPRNLNCELQALSKEYNCDSEKYKGKKSDSKFDSSSVCFERDNSKCIMCKRCVAVCSARQAVCAIGTNGRGFEAQVGCAFDKDINDIACVNCGQCVINCPTGALHDKPQTDEIIKAIYNPDLRVVVAMAPSTRVALGEVFGSAIGTNVESKMVAALRAIGFDDIFDVNFAADLTIMEEGHEFIEHFKNKKGLLLTSCCPAWIKFVEHFYPEFIPNLSTCKSPQQMYGAIMKTYYAKKLNLAPEKLFVVSIMPCIAKKFEMLRENQNAAGVRDIDAVLTARELGDLIKKCGIDFNNLEDGTFDTPFGTSSGAGVIFGATGGVMEAALRTVADTLENKELENIDYLLARGLKGTKEATIEVAGNKVNIAIVSGLANAKALLDKIKSGEKTYDFVEVMACPGGCANGGGMPIHPSYIINNKLIAEERAKGLYKSDKSNLCRKSHKNPEIVALYKNFLGKPGGELAHKILHTTYTKRNKF